MPEPESAGLHYVLEIEPIDLGPDVKAVGLDLMEVESREPAQGQDAAQIWAASVLAITAGEPWVLDFFAHLDRVRDYCTLHAIPYQEAASGRVILVPATPSETLAQLADRFAGETFGVRGGTAVNAADAELESGLAQHGVDAYHRAFGNYLFCGVCDFKNGFLTLLTEKLWTSEVIRRVKPAVSKLAVEVDRPR